MRVIFVILTLCRFSYAVEYDYEKIMNQYQYMSISKAMSTWSVSAAELKKISASNFKNLTSEKEKTQYLIYLFQNKKFIGEKRNSVIAILGEPTSYFFSEQNATYNLLKLDQNQWVVSFEVSSDQIVRSIKIAKKCCYEVK